jgi:hypothetical protein
VVEAIKRGLTEDGLSDLVRDVRLPDLAAGGASARTIDAGATSAPATSRCRRCSGLRTVEILAPSTLRLTFSLRIDWSAYDVTPLADGLPKDAHAAASQVVRLRTGENAGFVTEDAVALEEARTFDAPNAVG